MLIPIVRKLQATPNREKLVSACYARTGMYSMTFSMIDSRIALTVAFLFISPLLDSGSSSKEV